MPATPIDDMPRRSFWNSLRVRLLLALNVALLGGLLAAVVVDYQTQRKARLNDKHLALDEEANLLLPIIERLRTRGPAGIQEYIDAACGRMQQSSSPGHHIVVVADGEVVQAHVHARPSGGLFTFMKHADGNGISETNAGPILVGKASDDGASVYVSEYVTNVLAAARKQLLLHAGQVILIGLLVTGMTDLLMLRLFVAPVRRLVSSVRQMAGRNWDVHVPRSGPTELAILADEINAMRAALSTVEKSRQRQIDKARRLQDRLRPDARALAGWSTHVVYHPADGVGGDYVDVLSLGPDRLLVCVADVTGHGVPAALGAAMLKVLFIGSAKISTDPGEVLERMNREFARVTLEEDFASAMVVLLDRRAGQLWFASAGHEPAYLCTPEGITTLQATGPLLGIDSQATWDVTSIPLGPQDRLALLTDGWAESAAPDGELFGRERIGALLDKSASLPVAGTSQALLQTVGAWRQGAATDDLTLLLIDAREPPSQEPPTTHGKRLCGSLAFASKVSAAPDASQSRTEISQALHNEN